MDERQQLDEPTARFPFDAIYKAMCCHRQTVEDMLRAYLVEPVGPLRRQLVDALDFGTLRKLTMEWVTQEFHLRRGDQVWTVEFAIRAQRQGYPPFMLINLEFQSRRDTDMALRFHQHVAELFRELRAQRVIAFGDPCPVLCILLHNGRSLWTAPTRASDLVKLPSALGAPPDIPRGTTAFYPWGYHPLDFAAYRDNDHVPGNIISMMIGIEFARDRKSLVRPLWDTVRNLGDENLRQTVARWLNRLKEKYSLNLPGLEELVAMEDIAVLTSRLDETLEVWRDEALAQGIERGIERGMEQGHKQGVAETLSQIVRVKFGHATADQLAPLLGTAGPERLAELVDHALAAETGAELVSRLDEA